MNKKVVSSDQVEDIIKPYIDKKTALHPASTETLGGVKVDGTTITADENGVISASGGSYITVEPNAGAHNAVYRGKYLGDAVTDKQYAAIAAGTFDDLFIGDYWTIGGINYRIAAFDYFCGCVDVPKSLHHIVIVPDSVLYKAQMYTNAPTEIGYISSAMRITGLEQAKTIIKAAFNGHVLKHRLMFSYSLHNNIVAAASWVESEVDLMNELMVYGCFIHTSTNGGVERPLNSCVEKTQLPLFAYRPEHIIANDVFWLRDIVNSTNIALVNDNGLAHYGGAEQSLGVRPYFCII